MGLRSTKGMSGDGDGNGSSGSSTWRELGKVPWLRDYAAGLKKAHEENKPVLLLFQEVPGCSTCVGYGQMVLSNHAIVDAASTLFVPVAIFNNKGGADAEVLRKYREPSWNNPVVRFIDADEQQLAPRLNGDYSVSGLARSMCKALAAAGKTAPAALTALSNCYDR
ncbi:hypothetical protein PTSG_12573 [Salpingoeca rosetta]|uniref:Thioredoxin domain-containing protein n=1 Tax=Salpingoeca rosetta (strain ATCC 50818 / BSB-021) TaxID=946362 RepID=F2UJ49_SALR5|nr:uncharacterized protein PTSG_12573 [Salpingoeca rosetta]EGD76997.1 hypothetical protein PTSG_12573 [Salpingoeca rosetta]|eukprot:XP_004990837.1 hypothetical protein PTSG_12573 [Salpingoeca rosetta]